MHVGVISKVHQWCVQHLYLHENYYATISVEVRRLNDTLLRTVNKCFWILSIVGYITEILSTKSIRVHLALRFFAITF